jgi:hypothetical protein
MAVSKTSVMLCLSLVKKLSVYEEFMLIPVKERVTRIKC